MNYPILLIPNQDRNLSSFFRAVYDLNRELVEQILDNGELDVNSVHGLHRSDHGKELEDHMFQNFGCAMSGKVVCEVAMILWRNVAFGKNIERGIN